MKRISAIFLSLILALSLAACGGGNNDGNGSPSQPQQEAPDLNQYYEDFMATLGEDNTPAMMAIEGESVEQIYPGLNALETKQMVLATALISSVAFEFALVELADPADAQAAADIFQARIDYQVETGAYYPMTIENWENAEILTQGSVVALICTGSEQASAVEAFNALFA